MKRIKKLAILLFGVLVISASMPMLSSCSELIGELTGGITSAIGKTLETPQGLRIEDGCLCWNPVEFASKYTVSIDGKEYYANDCKYPLANVKDGEHIFKVKANGDGTLYYTSGYSNEYQQTITSGFISKNYSYKNFEELSENESFLGYGFDVINSSVFSDKYVKTSFPIFDTESLMEQRLLKVDSKQTYIEEVQSSNMESFMQQWNANANVGVSWGGKRFGGSVDVDVKYSGGVENAKSKYFHSISFYNQEFYIVMQSDMNTYRQILSDGFMQDLYSDMEPAVLFDRYGTHFITSAVMGGKINSYYLYTSEQERSYHDISAKVSVEVRAWKTNVNVDVSGGYRNEAESQNIKIKNTLEVIGGGDFGMISDTDVAPNYKEWEKSLDSNAALMGIKDTGSLVPVWELIDSSKDTRLYTYTDAAGKTVTGSRVQQLQAYFEKYGIQAYNALMESAGLPEIITPESIDNVRVNNQEAINGEYEVFAGSGNDISFSVLPEQATGYSKNISLSSPSEYATINNENGLSLEISSDCPHNTVFQIVLSAGSVRKNINVRVVKRYSVTFESNGGTEIEPYMDIRHGRQIDEPKEPVKEGYIFKGWYTEPNFEEGSEYLFGQQAIMENLTLYAQWEPFYPTITFVHNVEGCELQTAKVKYDNPYTLPNDLTNTGYTLEGCYSDKELLTPFDFTTKIVEDTTIYVKWKETELTVSFDTDGGSKIEDQIILYNKKIVKPENPTKEGYKFAGWYTDSTYTEESLYEFGKKVLTKDLTLYARWEDYYPTITFIHNVEGCDLQKAKVAYNTVFAKPTNLKIQGYDFVEFYNDVDMLVPFDFSAEIKTETTVYVKWQIHSYNVSFVTNCSMTIPTQSVEYKQKIVRPSAIENIGYEFVGWYKESELVNLFDFSTEVITQDTVLYAGWSQDLIDVYFDTNGGEAVDARKVQKGLSLGTNLPEPIRENYIFKGWYTSENYLDTEKVYSNSIFMESCTLFAKWEKAMIEISFDSHGGQYVNPIEIQSGKVLGSSLPAIEREFFEFLGWYKSAEYLEEEYVYSYTEFTETCTLHAKWKADVYVENELSFIPSEGLLIVDLWGYQTSDNADCGLIASEWYDSDSGVFTVLPSYKDIAGIKKVIFRGAYMQEDEYGEIIETKFMSFAIQFTETWTDDFTVEFDDFAHVAPKGKIALDFSAVQSENITINVVGNAYIKGGDGASAGANGCVGINATGKNLTITGDNLEVFGGNGEVGSSSVGNGGGGDNGIQAQSLTVELSNNALINVSGGNGAAAYNRGTGENNGDGSNGRNGYAGGAGGIAIKAVNVAVNSGLLTATGGNGGEGGDGSECNYRWGATVKGGNGGNGGNGATAIEASLLTVSEVAESISIELIGGNGGKTGRKGGCHNGDTSGIGGGASDGNNGIAGSGGLAISNSCIITDSLNIVVCENGSKGTIDTGVNWC